MSNKIQNISRKKKLARLKKQKERLESSNLSFTLSASKTEPRIPMLPIIRTLSHRLLEKVSKMMIKKAKQLQIQPKIAPSMTKIKQQP